jgi:hypothetical protein
MYGNFWKSLSRGTVGVIAFDYDSSPQDAEFPHSHGNGAGTKTCDADE